MNSASHWLLSCLLRQWWLLPLPCSHLLRNSQQVFFFQEEWNETPHSVTTRFQQSLSGGSGDRKRTPTGTGRCNLSAKHRQTTGQLPTPEMPGDPIWDTQTHIQVWASSRDAGTFIEHLLNTRPWLERQGSPACLQSCLPWELRSEPRHVPTSGPLHLLFPLLGCPPGKAPPTKLHPLLPKV